MLGPPPVHTNGRVKFPQVQHTHAVSWLASLIKAQCPYRQGESRQEHAWYAGRESKSVTVDGLVHTVSKIQSNASLTKVMIYDEKGL